VIALLAILLAPLGAEARVLKILSEREVVVGPFAADACENGLVFAIYPQDGASGEPIAFAEPVRYDPGQGCVAVVRSHPRSPLVRVNDATRAVDLKHGGQNIPGRYDLLREGHREYSSRYKPLVYGGLLFGQTASTLDRDEFLGGVFTLMYGITDRLQVDTTWSRIFERVGDLGGKYKLYENEDMKLSAYLQGTRYWQFGQGSWLAEIMFDNGSNGRSLSHTRLKFASKVPQQIAFVDQDQQKDYTIELSTVNEWMLKSWHRILFGPKFVAGDSYDLGFLFSMIFVFDRFHAAVNLDVNSVRHLDFKAYKQVVGGDLFWRF
jgi:hypothetical protein